MTLSATSATDVERYVQILCYTCIAPTLETGE